MSHAPITASFGMPDQMAVPNLCRGALTSWPQLLQAVQKLNTDPAFRRAYPSSYGSEQGRLLGSPSQLLNALSLDSMFLARATPPADIHARFIWIVLRVYRAARTFQVTISQLPHLLSVAPNLLPLENGTRIQSALTGAEGLIEHARGLVIEINDFLKHLQTVGGDLDAAKIEHKSAADTLAKESFSLDRHADNPSILAYVQSTIDGHQARHNLEHYQVTAAKVTAFSVIANMTMAIQTMSSAWGITVEQFSAIDQCAPEDLGQGAFLQNTLQLDQAIGEWHAFADVIQNFLQRILVIGATPLAS
jgi:hypothetical protein